ncbi:hypothetical protein Aph01nite_62150 [Acrocarpospora phusangensis]|uniref:Uncharacterized protein n=1 Tax=Acrocarpospora phusangensis TaxID=1070424 RepID=A0A919UTZ1_9ACTN|nr:hypothetical protein Aph01nite_62150 [Acrocarpospora phusangensis]
MQASDPYYYQPVSESYPNRTKTPTWVSLPAQDIGPARGQLPVARQRPIRSVRPRKKAAWTLSMPTVSLICAALTPAVP